LKTLVNRLRNYLNSNRNELRYFWKYAIKAKLHFLKYRSNKVILFRLDLIGDCTMFTSAAAAIREFYKDREMTVVCLAVSRPIYERMGIFDKIISVDLKPEAINWDIIDDIITEIRKDTYDILLQPQLSKFPLADILAAAVKCNRRISIEPITPYGNSSPAWIRMTNFLYNKLIPYPRGIVSEFDYYGAFVRGICNPDYKTTMPRLPYYEQNFIIGDYYVIYPGASHTQKLWPADRFAKIAEHIYKETGLTGVILGSANEQWVADDLKRNLNTIVGLSVIDLTGRTTIPDVIDIIGNAKFVVTNDTSGVHIAAATNTPSVVVAGGWHFKRFLPYHIEELKPGDKLPLVAYAEMPCYNCNWDWVTLNEKNPDCLERFIKGLPSMCIPAVTVEQVIMLVDRIIEEEALY